jgi:hypothetical protein
MLLIKIKKPIKIRPRLPLDAVLRLHSLPVTTKKGKKGYNRKRMNKEAGKSIEEDIESY